MTEEPDSNTDVVYVRLLDEGTEVWRPTKGIRISDQVYMLLATADYDPETESWKFPPGSIVRCEWEERSGLRVLVAARIV
jgi:hypothetical protein